MAGPNRRDFLKFGSLLSGGLAAARLLPHSVLEPAASTADRPNVIIFVFDATSATNLSLYGYPRKTTPNFERFAQRATVYNQHYSTDNYTTPGTASILTGLYPWTHRALNYSGLIARPAVDHNIFRAFGPQYHRLAYSQNMWPNYFFGQFKNDIDTVLSPGSFSVYDQVISAQFGKDLTTTHRAYDDLLFDDKHAPASLVFGLAQNISLYEAVVQAGKRGRPDDIAVADNYPIFFRLQDVFEGLLQTVLGLKAPSLAYLHIWSPHSPYRPSHEFAGLFDDDYHPVVKPMHALGYYTRQKTLDARRRIYDAYIANLDFEFGRLLDGLQAQGILDNSYVVIASDHGEMFERGVQKHATPLLYEPVVRIPLMISSPGQTKRRDIDLLTSNIDLLPTLVHLTGGEVPTWAEGQVLPGLGGPDDRDRTIFVTEAKDNQPLAPWKRATVVLRRGKYKLTYYTGYKQLDFQDQYELYDLESDPEELDNLYSESSATAQELRQELLGRLQAENAKYEKAG